MCVNSYSASSWIAIFFQLNTKRVTEIQSLWNVIIDATNRYFQWEAHAYLFFLYDLNIVVAALYRHFAHLHIRTIDLNLMTN